MQHTETASEKEQNTSKQRNKWLLVLVLVPLLGLFAGWLLPRLVGASYTYHGTVIQSPDPVANFTLTGPGGQPVSINDFRGKAVMLYFGYTFCPDVCPATLVELAKANQLLGSDAEKLQVIMVSVDPERDTPAILEEYVTHFDPSFIGLTGNDEEIAAAATPFGIYYEKHEGSAATGYLVDHTASVVVIDQNGHLRLIYPFGTAGEDIAEDIEHLVR